MPNLSTFDCFFSFWVERPRTRLLIEEGFGKVAINVTFVVLAMFESGIKHVEQLVKGILVIWVGTSSYRVISHRILWLWVRSISKGSRCLANDSAYYVYAALILMGF